MNKKNNIAYIDGANLHLGTNSYGLVLDYKKFKVWLSDKFDITDAYIFLGNIPKYSQLYDYLQECGFKIVFKQVVYDGAGKAKGNCDADLVLKSIQGYYENKYDKMLLVSSDGDYSSLVSFVNENNRFIGILSPYDQTKCSILLKRTNTKIYYLQDQKNLLKK
ncbi:MAG: NYN domain-containing protein [Patescibacteria group bacterium]